MRPEKIKSLLNEFVDYTDFRYANLYKWPFRGAEYVVHFRLESKGISVDGLMPSDATAGSSLGTFDDGTDLVSTPKEFYELL